MNYRDTLFFIGKCLTLEHEKHNYKEVKKLIMANRVNWENVIKLSSKHYVLPVLYLKLKKSALLSTLPSDLVLFLNKITLENEKRNREILRQIIAIEELFLIHRLKPIFIKGSGNLKQNLYPNIGERMVGDIDILFHNSETQKAQKILLKNGYTPIYEGPYIKNRHLKRLSSPNHIASVEVHDEIVSGKFQKEYCNKNIISNSLFGSIMRPDHQLFLTIAAHQINDKGRLKYTYSLRNAYDAYLLIQEYKNHLTLENSVSGFKIINDFLYQTKMTFNSDLIESKKTMSSQYRLFMHLLFGNNSKLNRFKSLIFRYGLALKSRLTLLSKALFSYQHRKYVFQRFQSREWRRRKIRRLIPLKLYTRDFTSSKSSPPQLPELINKTAELSKFSENKKFLNSVGFV